MRNRLCICLIVASTVTTARAASLPEPVVLAQGETTLHGFLYRPPGAGPFPAVIGLHGCAGLKNSAGIPFSRFRDWAERLVGAGIAVLYPDSYGSRGLGSQCTTRIRSVRTDKERVADANAARRWLQEQSWARPDRISLLGWSNGAISA
ncbi:MAG: prolyl oligopeptidase family serine peptidase, partial [Proteobacteria bacterium]|nr:prolyl oligopeptidase family serine peptidase [Pseudomonadota bacterium]